LDRHAGIIGSRITSKIGHLPKIFPGLTEGQPVEVEAFPITSARRFSAFVQWRPWFPGIIHGDKNLSVIRMDPAPMP